MSRDNIKCGFQVAAILKSNMVDTERISSGPISENVRNISVYICAKFGACITKCTIGLLHCCTISHQHHLRTSMHLITAVMLLNSRISASCFLQSYNLTVLMILQLWLYTYIDWIVPVSPSILNQPCCKWCLLMVNITSWKISKTWQLITSIYQRPAHAHQQICTQLLFSLTCRHNSIKDKKKSSRKLNVHLPKVNIPQVVWNV